MAEQTQEEQQQDGERLLMRFIHEKLAHWHVTNLLVLAEALQRGTGGNTPAEQFVAALAMELPHGLTSDRVRDCLMGKIDQQLLELRNLISGKADAVPPYRNDSGSMGDDHGG